MVFVSVEIMNWDESTGTVIQPDPHHIPIPQQMHHNQQQQHNQQQHNQQQLTEQQQQQLLHEGQLVHFHPEQQQQQQQQQQQELLIPAPNVGEEQQYMEASECRLSKKNRKINAVVKLGR